MIAYCKHCGKPINDQYTTCPHCGASQGDRRPASNDTGGFLWGLLGCCIPIVGLILFLVWKDEKPNTAKAAGIGALVSVGLAFAYYVFMFLFGFFFVLW